MTEEEYFRKTYPDSCYGDKPLSPYWDFFQDGVEFGERQSETKIEEIENYFVKSAGYGRDKVKNFMDIVNKALEQKGERIEELERKLEQTEKDLADYQFNYPKIKELEQEIVNLNSTLDLRKMQLDDSAEIIKEMQSNVDTLQKKNANLKEKLNFSTQYYLGEKAKDQLTKAKEIILKLYNAGRDVLMCRAEEKAYDNLENATNDRSIEQFLQEIEK